jgi:hypothetical protein
MSEELKTVNVDGGEGTQDPGAQQKQVIGEDGKAMTPEQIATKEAKAQEEAQAQAQYEEIKAKVKEFNLSKDQIFDIYGIKESVVPEKYADFTLPEGFELDTAVAEKAKGVFKELGLSQEKAQKLIELEANSLLEREKAKLDEFESLKKTWKEESIKALGSEAEKELQKAGRAMEVLGGAELRQILKDSGLEFHPAMVKLFINAGKALSPDNFPEGKKTGEGFDKSPAQAIYPGQGK